MVYKRAETAGTCPINNSNQNPFVFSASCQEYINKFFFVWVYELEKNNSLEFMKRKIEEAELKVIITRKRKLNFCMLENKRNSKQKNQ